MRREFENIFGKEEKQIPVFQSYLYCHLYNLNLDLSEILSFEKGYLMFEEFLQWKEKCKLKLWSLFS